LFSDSVSHREKNSNHTLLERSKTEVEATLESRIFSSANRPTSPLRISADTLGTILSETSVGDITGVIYTGGIVPDDKNAQEFLCRSDPLRGRYGPVVTV
jgi:hypothetical protein